MIPQFINFQFGDFFGSTPNWFDWINFIASILLASIGFAVAFCIYYKQLKNEALECYNFFNESLPSLENATKDTKDKIENFVIGLSTPNDNFTNPVLKSSFNTKLLTKIPFIPLLRAYKKWHVKDLGNFREFMLQVDFIDGYYEYFTEEINYFRNYFLLKEDKYNKWQLLRSNLFIKVVNSEKNSNEFKQEYSEWVNLLNEDREVISDGVMINRSLLVERHINSLRKIAFKYSKRGDSQDANEINQVCNEIYSVRKDMENLKDSLADVLKKDITTVNNIHDVLKKLIQ